MAAQDMLSKQQFAGTPRRGNDKWDTFVLKPPTHPELMAQPPKRTPAYSSVGGNSNRSRDWG